MSLNLNVNPEIEARFTAAAQQEGIDPATLLERMVSDFLPSVAPGTDAAPMIDAENAAVIALMDEWLAEAPTDPEGIRQAHVEVDELMQNLKKNRLDSGESHLSVRVCILCSIPIL